MLPRVFLKHFRDRAADILQRRLLLHAKRRLATLHLLGRLWMSRLRLLEVRGLIVEAAA